MGKLIKLVSILLLLVIVVGGVAFFMYIDIIAKGAIERGATYALGVETTLDGADVGVLSGEFSLTGLNVANPDGFDHPHFLHMNDAGMDVSLGTLREEIVEVPLLAFAGIDMSLERKNGDTNYKKILANLKRLETGEKKPSDDEGGKKRFIIRKLEVRDINVHVDLLPIGGDATSLEVPIDLIELEDIGSGSDKGVVISDLASILIKALLAAVIDKGGNLIPADLLGDLQGQLANLESLQDLGVKMMDNVQGRVSEEIGKATEDLTNQAQDAVDKAAGDAADKLNDGLKGILGGDKKK